MYKLASFIVKRRKIFALIFAALMVFSAFSFRWVKVEENINTYLDEDSATKKGLYVLEAEFKTYAQTTVLVRDIKKADALDMAERMEALDGVCLVNCETSYYRGQYDAVYTVIFNGESGDTLAEKGNEEAHELLSGLDYTFISQGYEDYAETLTTEMIGVLGLVVIIVLAVLLLTSSTYAEIAVLLLTFITAAVINLGTNFLLGTISFVSNAVAVVLQLALSVDYAIIFCNRYKEEHASKGIEDAAISALAFSIPAISASSLTTIAGLAAMTFMKFSLGTDMGVALIKSIVLSLLTVFLFMPFLIVSFGGLMDRTAHRNFLPKIDFAGRFAYRSRFIMPILFAAVLVAAYFGAGNVQYDFDKTRVKVFNESAERRAERDILEKFGDTSMVVLIVPTEDYGAEAEFTREVEALPQVKNVLAIANIDAAEGYKLSDSVTYADFMELANVDETMAKALFAYYAADVGEGEKAAADLEMYSASLIDVFIKLHDIANSGKIELTDDQLTLINDLYAQLTMALDQLKGENYSCMIVYLNLHVEGEETFAFIDELTGMAKARYGENIYITGNPVAAKDFSVTFLQDTRTVTYLSILLVMAILLLTFRSMLLPVILILVIQGSIWINFAIPAWKGDYVFFMCSLIVTAIQMGANIDYAIVISSRYTEMRDSGLEPKEAIIKTLNLAFPTIITSGTMMVVAGLLIGFRISEPIVAGMGYYVGTGTVVSLVLVNFVLPQLLVLSDRPVRATTLRIRSAANARRAVSVISAGALIAAIVFTGAKSAPFKAGIEEQKAECSAEMAALKERVEELKPLNATLESEDLFDTKYSFAEAAVTEDIGSRQLLDGEKQYEDGKALLEDAKRKTASGETQYSAGVKLYEDSLKEYEAGKARLEAGQAEYDAGAAQLEAAKVQLAEGEAQLSSIKPVYDLVMPLYNSYQRTQKLYDKAVADGDEVAAALLSGKLAADKALFENTLLGTGYSLSGIISEYEAGRAQADDGRAQIEAAEAQLAAAKAEIDDGKAQLADAEKQLADGRAQLQSARGQLDSAYVQISDGEKELKDAEAQLEDGEAQLEENSGVLSESLTKLESYNTDSEKLRQGLRKLLDVRGISDRVTDRRDHPQVLSAAEEYIEDTLSEAEIKAEREHRALLLLHLAAAAAILTLLTFLWKRICMTFAALTAAFAIASAVIFASCGDEKSIMLLIALAIAFFSIAFAAAGRKTE